jgi:hypothetical protein
VVADALTYCDLTIDTKGRPIGVTERLADIELRYGPSSLTSQALRLARPHLLAAVRRTERDIDSLRGRSRYPSTAASRSSR